MLRARTLVPLLALVPIAAGTLYGRQDGGRAARLDSLITREMKAQQIPGAAVAVVEDGKVTLARAWGYANLETGTPLDTSAVFELASVTKQFTAAALLLLVEAGKVGLDDPVGKYVKNTPESWARITVRMLLGHTSGLPIDGFPGFEGSPLLLITSKQAFEFIARQPLIFPPGEGAFYSDAAYFLAGMVIEKASGLTYRAFMQRIFDRVGMTSSSIIDQRRILRGRVATYELRDGQLLNWRRDWDHELPSFFGVFSTLADMVRWDQALRSGGILKQSSLDAMWTPTRQISVQPLPRGARLLGRSRPASLPCSMPVTSSSPPWPSA